jgi:hypothetical protein
MKSQNIRLLTFFQAKQNKWVSLWTILNLRISQYNARIWDLRQLGFDIRNKIEFKDGVKHSWYMFVGLK